MSYNKKANRYPAVNRLPQSRKFFSNLNQTQLKQLNTIVEYLADRTWGDDNEQIPFIVTPPNQADVPFPISTRCKLSEFGIFTGLNRKKDTQKSENHKKKLKASILKIGYCDTIKVFVKM